MARYFNRPMTDYTTMEDNAAYKACGKDHTKWAAYFCQIAKQHGHDLDEAWMQTWFANAMMAAREPEPGPVWDINGVILNRG
jgi:hypothetical protein